MPHNTFGRIGALIQACAVAALFAGCTTKPAAPPSNADSTRAGIPTNAVSNSSAPTISAPDNSPAALELGHNIDRAIDESEFASARWGVCVVSLRDGRVLYARNADRGFTPASNMKVYTTAAALDLLGAGYRWRTSVFADIAPDANGTIAGDVTLYGRGAPDLASHTNNAATANLVQLADELYRRGVRRVRGAVVGDESYFRGEPLGDGWLWNDVQWYFGAEVSALSINGNEIMLTVTPANETDKPAETKTNLTTDYLHVRNETNTIKRGAIQTLGITRNLSDNDVRVWGDFPAGGQAVSARLSVHQPALWAATLFREALRARGIVVEGEARMRDARVSSEQKFDSQRAVELAFITSQTLGEIVRATNKESINLNAELILRTLGKERGASAPDPSPRKMQNRGDDEAGAAVIRQWLSGAGISTNNVALHDGSGLSRLDLVTPEATARLMMAMTRSPAANDFRDSLPIAGQDGTLAFRLREASTKGRINAKTGTLTYDNSLSGYLLTADDEPLAFSIFCNDEITKASSTHVIDAIATLLATYHRAQP
jgi:D-alanyl-D-alanine carboxypeptidase/D-alanyl-D-alanine-endopeptidase (penicillin-binding protein 4)